MTCKHEYTYEDEENCFIICIECGRMFESCPLRIYSHGKSHRKRQIASDNHCTRKYFTKLVEKLDLNQRYQAEGLNLDRLFEDFDKQENVLKKVLKNENRKNSLNVQYKLHKLLSRQGVSCPEVKLPKCSKTLIENDRIMNLVWNKLGWNK